MNKLFDKAVKTLQKFEPAKQINIMEVCGTHTMAISRNGLRQKFPPNINLISGPGCPVCVTSAHDIDWVIEIVKRYDLKVFTFGDMVRVPGTSSSLVEQKSLGKDISVCYSPADALSYAAQNPGKDVLFIAIGFETTTPLTSVILKEAYNKGMENFSVFSTHKLVPPALSLLLKDPEIKIDGFLCPGHVSAIIGSGPYEFIPRDYRIPCVISGFEPTDIMISVAMILKQLKDKKPTVHNQYTRVVRKEGNPVALESIYEVFKKADSDWRGLGIMPGSGLELREKYSMFDAKLKFEVAELKSRENPACDCGDILKGLKKPPQCKLFANACTPQNPVGPCMVSSEGSCAAYYRYERLNIERSSR
ncbi:MAG: hydrogenase formation protein HypD [Actinomycetota bacterium]